MIVGAPLDNETSKTLTDKKVGRPGTVYRCTITQGSDCVPIIVDKGETFLVLLIPLIYCTCTHFRLYLC